MRCINNAKSAAQFPPKAETSRHVYRQTIIKTNNVT